MTEIEKKIAVLIVAGGNGSRMGADIPKQYLRIHGKMILRHSIDIFINMPEINMIQCVIHPDYEEYYQQAVDGLSILPAIHGGDTRQQSVYNGLKALEQYNPDIVLIHDAARPCVDKQDIHTLIHSMKTRNAVTLAQKVTESLQRNGENIPRDDLWIVQTPQAFHYNQIWDAHEHSVGASHTDDTSIYMAQTNNKVHYVPCGRHNLKITTQEDLKMAEKLLNSNFETRTGLGFDVHAFDDNAQNVKTIRLCGIDVPYHKKLKGHSDADVGLHAVTDAILGALGAGDIGMHFPPSNNDFKDMDSHIFLNKAVDILWKSGGKINHLDITFMCEEPKIGKARDSMVNHLAETLKISTGRVSVKATTTEKLGFTGRGEGIACHAIVTIQVPSDG